MTDARTRVVAVSWVAFHNGWVFPLEELAAFCRERGILLVVDAIQGLGLLPMDVRRAGVDVLAADAHKWLYGPEGCAIFYVSEEARDRVPAIVSGWWSMKIEGRYLEYRGRAVRERAPLRARHASDRPHSRTLGCARSARGDGTGAVRERVLGLVTRPRRRALGARMADRLSRAAGFRNPRRRAARGRDPCPLASFSRSAASSPRRAKAPCASRPHAGNDLEEVERALAAIDAIA